MIWVPELLSTVAPCPWACVLDLPATAALLLAPVAANTATALTAPAAASLMHHRIRK